MLLNPSLVKTLSRGEECEVLEFQVPAEKPVLAAQLLQEPTVLRDDQIVVVRFAFVVVEMPNDLQHRRGRTGGGEGTDGFGHWTDASQDLCHLIVDGQATLSTLDRPHVADGNRRRRPSGASNQDAVGFDAEACGDR